jgi:hypothetical protein
MDDFAYYAARLLKIKTKDGELAPFRLWQPQLRLHSVLSDLKERGKLQRVIVLKARQEGISTYTEGRIFHASHFTPNTKNVVITHDKESGSSIFTMCHLFYESLPPHLRPMTRFSSKKEIVFENPDKKERYKNPGLRSRLEVYTAGKKSVGRSTTIHNLHCSELASWSFASDTVPSLLPTVPKNTNSLVVYESTAKGVGNFFHREWLRAEDGSSNFVPFFLAWFDLDKYRWPFTDEKEKQAFKEHLNDEEKELMAQFHLDLEQLYWRRLEIAELSGDLEFFRQEYPSTAEEAFIVSGVPVFDRAKLRMMSLKCKPPRFRGDLTEKGPRPNEDGPLKIWRTPEPGAIYTVGVDVADGGEQGDYSCAEVWRKLPAPYVAEQVAEWHGHLDPYNFAHIVERLGRWYNEALVAVEINAHGLATQNELQRGYWNLYRQEYYDRYDNKPTKKLGWETTLRSKKLLISFGTHCISDMTILVHSDKLIREAMTFVRDESGGASASGNGYDDRIMAALIGLFVMHQAVNEEPVESADFQTQAQSIVVPKQYRIDPDFDEIVAYGSDGDYEQTWMNY